MKLLGTVATGLPYFSKDTLAALAKGSDPDLVTPTLVYTLLILQLAEQALPSFDPSEYLTERGRQIYDMARTACYGEMANAVTSGQVSSRVALAKDPAPVLEFPFPRPGVSDCSASKAHFRRNRRGGPRCSADYARRPC